MERYSAYKDSGIEWIGEIPESWGIHKLRRIAVIDRGTADKSILEGERIVHLVQYTDIYYKTEQFEDDDYIKISVTDNEWEKANLEKGDLLVTASSETKDDIGHSSLIAESLSNHVFGSDIIRIRFCSLLHDSYKKYLLENHFYLSMFDKMSRGITRFCFSMDDFKSLQYPIPTIDQQKDIADYLDSKIEQPGAEDESINPLFCWTANWTNTFDGRKEDLLVMVNRATRFTVTIYGIKSRQFKNIKEKIAAAIKNTLLAINLNPELVDEYMRQAGELTFASNHDRKMTAQVNHQGLHSAFVVGRAINDSWEEIKYEDTLGGVVSEMLVNYGNNPNEAFAPAEKMTEALVNLTGKPAYKYRAFELLVTLDLGVYEATRRLIVPSDISFQKLHKVLQKAFKWENYHLYDFAVFDNKAKQPCIRLIPNEESLDYDYGAVLMDDHSLDEYLPAHGFVLYTYDMGDNWEHKIELISIIENHTEDSPYLLEAVGQTPPEDVGGVSGFISFREIILNPEHPEYDEAKEWVGFWSPELREWDTRPKKL